MLSERTARCSGKALNHLQPDGCGLGNSWCANSRGLNGNREANRVYYCHCQTFYKRNSKDSSNRALICPLHQYGSSEGCTTTQTLPNLHKNKHLSI